MQSIQKNIPGIVMCLAIAIPSWLLGKLVPVIGGPVFSILIGMVITMLRAPGSTCRPGVNFVSKKVLQAAVVLLGFGLNLNVVLQTGKQSLPIIVCTITTSLVVSYGRSISSKHNHSSKRADRRSMSVCPFCVCITSAPSGALPLHLPVPASAPWSRAASGWISAPARTGTSPAPAQARAVPALISGRSEILPWLPSFPERFLLQSMRVFRLLCRQIEPVFFIVFSCSIMKIVLLLTSC